MQSTEKLAQIDLNRQELLLIWMRRNSLSYSDIAKAMEVSPSTVRAWFEAESIPTWRHEQLVKFGIPAELLPSGINIAPGPRRGAK